MNSQTSLRLLEAIKRPSLTLIFIKFPKNGITATVKMTEENMKYITSETFRPTLSARNIRVIGRKRSVTVIHEHVIYKNIVSLGRTNFLLVTSY